MTVMEDIASVIRLGGRVVMGIGVAPERYRQLLQNAINQDYLVIGAKDSPDVSFIASKIGGEFLEPQSLSVLGLEMNVYFVKSEKVMI